MHFLYQNEKANTAGEMDFTYYNAVYTVENALAKVKDEKGISGAGLLLGTALSYTVIPSVANVLAVQSGFSYTPVFDSKAACISICSILVLVLILTVLAAGKIKRLKPINAIRGIDPLKPMSRNLFPLDTSKGSVALNLTFKQAGASAGRNLLLFAVTFVMMILLAFTGVLVYDVNIRPENFLTTLSEELPDIRVQSDESHFEELKEILKSENVKAVNYGIASGEYSDGSLPVIIGTLLCRPIKKITAYSLIKEG